jgi:hypothetical protein
MTESLKQITVYSILNFFGQNHIILTLICHNHVCREARVIGYLVVKIGYMILFYILHTFHEWITHLPCNCNRFWRFTNHLPTSTNQSHSFFFLLSYHITYIVCIVSSHFSDLIFSLHPSPIKLLPENGRVVLAFWYRGTLQIPIHYFHPFTAQSRDHDSRCRFDLIHVITMSFWFDSLHFCFLCSVAVC